MKRLFILLVLFTCAPATYSQDNRKPLGLFFKEFHLSAECGYNYLPPSFKELFPSNYNYDHYWHHQWYFALAAENNTVKWRIALGRDYLDYTEIYNPVNTYSYHADYMRPSMSLQFFLLKKPRLHILFGASVELFWITRYDFSYGNITLHNPDIGSSFGANLLFPLTFSVGLTERSRVNIQTACGTHLRDDHQLPYMDHWAHSPYDESSLRSHCPLYIGVGYSFHFK